MGENTDYVAAELTQEERDALESRTKHENPVGYSENGDYQAAPAFDSPEEQLEHDAEEAEKEAQEEAHQAPVYHEN